MKSLIKYIVLFCLVWIFHDVFAKSIVPLWFVGGWEYQGCDDKKIMCMVKDFTFNKDGTYNIDAYPPARHRGQYKVKTVSATEAVLDLSNQTGDWSPWKAQIKLVYDNSKNTLSIDGEGPYSKLEEVKTNHREPGEQ